MDHFGLGSLKDLPGLKELRAAGLLESRLPPGVLFDDKIEEREEENIDQSDMFGEEN